MEVVQTLNAGGVVVMPTETQYSLSIRADSGEALKKIQKIKKREASLKPALFVRDMNMAEKFCVIGDSAKRLASSFLPGPLTIVLPGKDDQNLVPTEFRTGFGYGIRISSSPLIAAVMREMKFPVTATSANPSGEAVSSSIDSIIDAFGDEVDLYVDGGMKPSHDLTPSTVVWAGDEVQVLRQGIIPEADIRNSVGKDK